MGSRRVGAAKDHKSLRGAGVDSFVSRSHAGVDSFVSRGHETIGPTRRPILQAQKDALAGW